MITIGLSCAGKAKITLSLRSPSGTTLASQQTSCRSDDAALSATASSSGTYSVELRETRGYHTSYTLSATTPDAGTATTTTVPSTTTTTVAAPAPSTPGVSVSGNRLVNENGAPVRLLGVNRSGTEYACAEGWGIFDGPRDAASVDAMKSWNITAVRVPLNETCWLGINGVNPSYSGTNYRQAIGGYVSVLRSKGLIPVLDLHWSAPGTEIALKNRFMPNMDHSPAFWASVASYFKHDPAIVFNIFNEPRIEWTSDAAFKWSCWRDGCMTPYGWHAAGMQTLVNAVRSTGAGNVILIPGLNYANDLTGWLAYKPNDPLGQLAADFHSYNSNFCNTTTCWESKLAPVAASVPLVTGELGQNDCAHGYIDGYMSWADARGVSYLGWSWNPFSCTGQPALITSYDGTPTNYGIGLRDHLRALPTA
ncbi:MAG TPA: cellulase family glycosylhydrolase [Acidimicrobiales bacterium]|nr:cellulase family glycosylhydrolase [Acidimicrobiales bacterium]